MEEEYTILILKDKKGYFINASTSNKEKAVINFQRIRTGDFPELKGAFSAPTPEEARGQAKEHADRFNWKVRDLND